MLKLLDIKKDYLLKDQEPVHALKGVSLNFRRNEFVAILGPSGCGKTTLLNIIGGLDRYTSGDLIIEGKSTKEFGDRDWDNYRNHSVGFVFQSYNLISHQTILKNVELALTISGVGKQERKHRAEEALKKVGLGGLGKKKPNQMSGGQMQRVAIARALVNNPEIVLADEPTGALDSETSIQIMDLLKEVAQDRLVIMVTHNPDLAKQYATRIVSMKDGLLLSDSNPYNGEVNVVEKIETKPGKKSLMSFFTACGLSFNNLISKARRTVLVSIAGSIGIIGISAVLAVSFGVTNYIASMQDDMLSSYPLSIAEETVDLTSLTNGLNASTAIETAKFDVTTSVGMQSMVKYLMERYSDITNIKTNDINENLLQYLDDMDRDHVVAAKLNFGIDVTNNIFTTAKRSDTAPTEIISLNGLTQRYIEELKTVDGFSKYASYVNLFTNFMKSMPDNEEYVLNQYDLIGNSSFARDANEIMIVVDTNTTLTDLLLAQMGFYNHDEFLNISKKAIKCNEAKKKYEDKKISKEEYEALLAQYEKDYPYRTSFKYEDLIGKEMYYLPSKTMWSYGNVSTKTSMTGTVLINSDTDIFYLQLANYANYDILAGYHIIIGSTSEPEMVYFARNQSESRDPDTFLLDTWAGFDISTFQPDKTALVLGDVSGTKTAVYIPNTDDPSIFKAFTNVFLNAAETDLVNGFNYPAVAKDEWIKNLSTYGGNKVKIAGILRAKSTTKFGCLTRGIYYNDRLTEKYMLDAKDSNNKILQDDTNGFYQFFKTGKAESNLFPAYVTYDYLDYSKDDKNPTLKTGGYAYALNSSGSSSLLSLFSAGTGTASYSDLNTGYLRAVCGQKMIEKKDEVGIKTYEFKDYPQQIQIYPKNFQSKDVITDYLKEWNKDKPITLSTGKVLQKKDRIDITYTDTVAMIITVINMLITIITSALIAFTSLSLIVSCFMIAVITYISVVERVKEIGVIRSLGGRKKDVARLFTAENLFTGLSSGVFGIVITYALSLLLNGIVSIFGVPALASLPWWTALIMIALSIVLNVISGFIPSRSASKQDPVIALRSE